MCHVRFLYKMPACIASQMPSTRYMFGTRNVTGSSGRPLQHAITKFGGTSLSTQSRGTQSRGTSAANKFHN
jgi:hypothetical protein